MPPVKHKRVLLKLGGEALANPSGSGISPHMAEEVAAKVIAVRDLDVEVALVLGAGNIWRGRDGMEHGMAQATADQMGMLATIMNALVLADALERLGQVTRVQTAIEMRAIAEPYIRLRAIRHLEKGRIVIIGGGTGNPYFTTDTAAALRAMEVNADLLVKATKVDGVYAEDPHVNPDAQRFDSMTYMQALELRVGVMDATAISLCMEHEMPILVLSLWQPHGLERAVSGEPIGTLISRER